MTKAYSDSVKLPNLISVIHPLKKVLSKSGLNVEGNNIRAENNSAHSRNIYITSILGKKKKSINT